MSGTRHLTPEEEGVYLRLINYYYDTEKPIPLETQSVIRRLMLGSCSDIVNSILNEFFIKTDKGYEKEKCNELIREYKKTSKKNKSNGLKGGRPSKNEASKETQDKPTGLISETQDKPTGNLNQELLTNNHKPIKDKEKTKRFVPPSIEEVRAYCLERGNQVDPDNFVNHYQGNGWMRGKNKIKDWKACVKTWEARDKQDKPKYQTAQERRADRNSEIFDYEKATTF
jgi:uncharacterized protein YdaU (DUF1376 family)